MSNRASTRSHAASRPLLLKFLAGCLAERLECRVLYEVCPADPERLKLRAVDATLDPLVHCLACDGWVHKSASFLDAMVIPNAAITGPHP